MTWKRRTAVLLLAAALAGCSTTVKTTPRFQSQSATPSASATAFASGSLHWTGCHSSSFQCATLTVPLNYSNPSQGTITLALIRKPARDAAHRIGSLLVNPGGPGGSGIEFLTEASGLFTTINQRFDIVSFDPRGVGESTPVRCLSPKQMDAFIAVNPEPTTPAQVQQAVAASKSFAQGCEQTSGRILPYVGTVNAARDMESMRIALGDAKLTYVGFSYGTFLGATYADLYPTHVRAMVLDGAVDPALTADQIARTQAGGFEKNLQAFLSDCAGHTACVFHNGGRPEAALDRLLQSLQQDPLQVNGDSGTRTLGLGEAFLGILAALYSPDTWSDLAIALHDAQDGDGALLLALADTYDERHTDGTYSNEMEANAAVNCADGPAPGSLQHMEQLASQLAEVSPHFGVASAFGPLACTFWPFQATGRTVPRAVGSPPLLVIGGTNDPATPYTWAQALSHELANAVLVTRTGDGHVSYDKSSCVRKLANAYLLDPTVLPAAGTVCPSD